MYNVCLFILYTGKPPPGCRNRCFTSLLFKWFIYLLVYRFTGSLVNWFASELVCWITCLLNHKFMHVPDMSIISFCSKEFAKTFILLLSVRMQALGQIFLQRSVHRRTLAQLFYNILCTAGRQHTSLQHSVHKPEIHKEGETRVNSN